MWFKSLKSRKSNHVKVTCFIHYIFNMASIWQGWQPGVQTSPVLAEKDNLVLFCDCDTCALQYLYYSLKVIDYSKWTFFGWSVINKCWFPEHRQWRVEWWWLVQVTSVDSIYLSCQDCSENNIDKSYEGGKMSAKKLSDLWYKSSYQKNCLSRTSRLLCPVTLNSCSIASFTHEDRTQHNFYIDCWQNFLWIKKKLRVWENPLIDLVISSGCHHATVTTSTSMIKLATFS